MLDVINWVASAVPLVQASFDAGFYHIFPTATEQMLGRLGIDSPFVRKDM